jgi:hypothetical protein
LGFEALALVAHKPTIAMATMYSFFIILLL